GLLAHVDVGLLLGEQRAYDPSIGEWLSEDPLRGDTANPNSLAIWGYANANPTRYTDPTGEFSFQKGWRELKARAASDFGGAASAVANFASEGLNDLLVDAGIRDRPYRGMTNLLPTASSPARGGISLTDWDEEEEERWMKNVWLPSVATNPTHRRIEHGLIAANITARGIALGASTYAGGEILLTGLGESVAFLERGLIGAVESGASREVAARVAAREALLDATPLPGGSWGGPRLLPAVAEAAAAARSAAAKAAAAQAVEAALRNFGLTLEAQRALLVEGRPIAFNLSFGAKAPMVCGLNLAGGRLSSGIISINDETGLALNGMIAFRGKTMDLARALGAEEVELFGGAIINDKIKSSLLRQGYLPKRVAIPAELGGGEMDVLSKVFPVPRK
ncbi:MAG: hypothetical protein HY901_15595, partial [Deltaproteobacteria bacterium]|nr:hypothetical protein [Deltaproteobacteria bacterium]